MLYVLAENIKSFGGVKLLYNLVESMVNCQALIYVNRAFSCGTIGDLCIIKRRSDGLISRICLQLYLFFKTTPQDTVLCFGNFPPILKLRCRCVVFLQNRLILDPGFLGQPVSNYIVAALKKFIFLCLVKNCDKIIVQTQSMADLVPHRWKYKVKICPFISREAKIEKMRESEFAKKTIRYDFIYPSTGEYHKNHLRLIQAIRLIAKKGLYPSLALTIDCDRFPVIAKAVDEAITIDKTKIINLGELSSTDMAKTLRQSKCLIFPSCVESFGLPLIEADSLGCDVIAGELDYVRDVVQPIETFDVGSALSISRAILRYINVKADSIKLQDGTSFVAEVTG